jgi:hypothetical protein
LLPIQITLAPSVDPAAVKVGLDGADVTSSFAPGGPGLVGAIPVPPPGTHRLEVTRPLGGIPMIPFTTGHVFVSPSAAPALVGVEPPSGGGPVPRSAWLRFRLSERAEATDLAGFGFGIECDGRGVPRAAHALDDGALILNPTPALPAGASCRVAWRGEGGGVAETTFTVAPDAAGTAATAIYDRSDPLALAPFPDDYFTTPDASMPTGLRVELPVPPFSDPFQVRAFESLVNQIGVVDGWSRYTPIVLHLSHPLDPQAVPQDEFASMDAFAPIALVDVDPASPDFGRRVPHRMVVRSDVAGGALQHAAMLFPTIDLRERGRYALVVTRRAFAANEPGRPFGPSAFFADVLEPPDPGHAPEVARAREVAGPALDALAALLEVPIPPEDVALLLRISTRTRPGVADLVHVKELALAAPPPELVLPDLATDPCPNVNNFCVRLSTTRALEVRGRVVLPNFRDEINVFARDPVTGLPVQTGTSEVPFVMTLPLEALDGPVVPVMYQHGNPGSPREILAEFANGHLDDAGFALMGIQDTLNRELGQDINIQVQVIFFFLTQTARISDLWIQTGADMIFFLRAIQGMDDLDLLHRDANGAPAIGPDGVPEIDPSTILYKGISEGANNAQRFLPFAPEILAAEPTVGGARLGETLIHQSAAEILAQLGAFLPELTPVELWVGLSLFQAGYDPQDGHSYLPYLYREPLLPFAGSTDVTPPSTIWTEGIGDTFVPNNASRAMAHALGLPHVRPVARALPTLEQVDAPLSSNIAPGITAGYFQYDPATTPDCRDRIPPQTEGHFCPQTAAEAQAQRLHFLMTALAGNPEIIDPF